MNKLNAPLFLFLEGAVAVSTQFIYLRQVIPHVGSSVIVTSVVISFFLAALAAGYKFGGNVSKMHDIKLSKNLLTAGILLSITASTFFADAIFQLSNGDPTLNTLVILPLYLIVGMMPVVYLLGQTIPLLINYIDENQTASEKGGDALFFSTIGNVVGGLVSTVILMYVFGVGATILINSIALIVLSIMLNKRDVETILKISFAMVIPIMIYVSYDLNRYVHTNAYANYEVAHMQDSKKNGKYFLLNNSYASKIDDEGSSFAYIEFIKKMMFEIYNLHKKEILVLGAGGFSLSWQLNNNENHFTYVDIDPNIVKVASRYFLPDQKVKGSFVADDARAFLKSRPEDKWDAILIDLYSSKYDSPWHLSSRQFFLEVKSHLKPETMVFINVLTRTNFSSEYSRNLDSTIRASFDFCTANFVSTKNVIEPETINIAYTCFANEIKPKIYVDDNTRLSVDNFLEKNL